jgi:hypothetical protein
VSVALFVPTGDDLCEVDVFVAFFGVNFSIRSFMLACFVTSIQLFLLTIENATVFECARRISSCCVDCCKHIERKANLFIKSQVRSLRELVFGAS